MLKPQTYRAASSRARRGRCFTIKPGALLCALFVLASFGCNACGSTSKEADTPTPSVSAELPPEPVNTASGGQATSAQNESGGCKIGGCASELCVEAGSASAPAFSNCEYKRHYECFKQATCARDAQSQCNWEDSPLLTKCLERHGVN